MTAQHTSSRFVTPGDPVTALRLLAEIPASALLAGGTWLMRRPLRRETQAETFVSLQAMPALHVLESSEPTLRIGAQITHDRLARDLPRGADLAGLASAALRSANPGVRRLATVGGNLCTPSFAAADLCPALLALDATVEVATLDGPLAVPMEAFLTARRVWPAPWLLTAVVLARTGRVSAHERLPMRRAGDYPTAIVSVSADVDAAGRVSAPRVAVGAVEATARRWRRLEAVLEGRPLDPAAFADLARDRVDDFEPRDGLDAPGWYRISVLPALVRRAFAALGAGGDR